MKSSRIGCSYVRLDDAQHCHPSEISCRCNHLGRCQQFSIHQSIRDNLLGVIIDSNVHFDKHAGTIAKACNYHIRVLRHVQLTTEMAHTVACSTVGSRLNCCDTVMYGALMMMVSSAYGTTSPGQCACAVVRQTLDLFSNRCTDYLSMSMSSARMERPHQASVHMQWLDRLSTFTQIAALTTSP